MMPYRLPMWHGEKARISLVRSLPAVGGGHVKTCQRRGGTGTYEQFGGGHDDGIGEHDVFDEHVGHSLVIE